MSIRKLLLTVALTGLVGTEVPMQPLLLMKTLLAAPPDGLTTRRVSLPATKYWEGQSVRRRSDYREDLRAER